MSAKCIECGEPIFDEDGQCYGADIAGIGWVCEDCLYPPYEQVASLRSRLAEAERQRDELLAAFGTLTDEDRLAEFAGLLKQYSKEPVINLLEMVFPEIAAIARARSGEDGEGQERQ